VPVQWVHGVWKPIVGKIGEINANACAELVIDARHFAEKKLVRVWTAKRRIPALPPGSELRVALTVNPDLERAFVGMLLSPNSTPYDITSNISVNTRFVSIRLVGPTDKQKEQKIEPGGLWLWLTGMDVKKLESGLVELPGLLNLKQLDSLNQAFTRLSERFEPWRKSHTGNIYNRIYYQESNSRWYPLDDLRDRGRGAPERKVHGALWKAVVVQLEPPGA
jgi:hypothetical protein